MAGSFVSNVSVMQQCTVVIAINRQKIVDLTALLHRRIFVKLTKKILDDMAETLSDRLLCSVGLRQAKKVAGQIKRNLLAEDKRRKDLRGT